MPRQRMWLAGYGGRDHPTVGEELLFLTEVLFGLWYKVRDGTRSHRWLLRQVEGRLRAEVRGWLERGSGCSSVKTASVCQEVLKLEPALWTFTRLAGVEPTNNAAERALVTVHGLRVTSVQLIPFQSKHRVIKAN